MPHLILTAFALALCSGCGNVLSPTVELRSASVEKLSAEGANLQFRVEVANPNDFALPVSAATYTLRLGGLTVLDGEAMPTGTIPAAGKLPVTIPITLSFDRMLLAEPVLIESKGDVPYDLFGSLVFSVGPLKALSQGVRVPLKFSGTLPLRDALKNPIELLQSPAGRKFVEAVLGKGSLGNWLGK